ncbi:MAG: polymer-forming cytoskeletal protein [Anaerolineales bacterium]|nr:polymer-forming cytoskeletal protein [Anaerolineales bacterium]
MFKKREEPAPKLDVIPAQIRVTSILGENTNLKGELTGKGGIRIVGLFEGKIDLEGLIIIDQKGRVESDLIKADTVIIGGSVRSDIQAKRVEIRRTGRVWGNVTTVRFSTEEGAYLRGKIQMEEEIPEEKEIESGEVDSLPDKKAAPELKPKTTKG